MNVKQVVRYFGGDPKEPGQLNRVAKAVGVTRQAIDQWVEKGRVPEISQWRIQHGTGGALKVDREFRKKMNPA